MIGFFLWCSIFIKLSLTVLVMFFSCLGTTMWVFQLAISIKNGQQTQQTDLSSGQVGMGPNLSEACSFLSALPWVLALGALLSQFALLTLCLHVSQHPAWLLNGLMYKMWFQRHTESYIHQAFIREELSLVSTEAIEKDAKVSRVRWLGRGEKQRGDGTKGVCIAERQISPSKDLTYGCHLYEWFGTSLEVDSFCICLTLLTKQCLYFISL